MSSVYIVDMEDKDRSFISYSFEDALLEFLKRQVDYEDVTLRWSA